MKNLFSTIKVDHKVVELDQLGEYNFWASSSDKKRLFLNMLFPYHSLYQPMTSISASGLSYEG